MNSSNWYGENRAVRGSLTGLSVRCGGSTEHRVRPRDSASLDALRARKSPTDSGGLTRSLHQRKFSRHAQLMAAGTDDNGRLGFALELLA